MNRERKAKADRERKARRKAEFFSDKSCKRCGTTNNLVLHHRNPNNKKDHRIWSWKLERRLEEIAKCDVVCDKCHKQIHRELDYPKGSRTSQAKLTEEDILKIRTRLQQGQTLQQIADVFGVTKSTISSIKVGRTWKHVR